MLKNFINNICKFFYSTSLYQRLFLNKLLKIKPMINLSIFHPLYFRGHAILDGEFNILGKSYQMKNFEDLSALNKDEKEFIHRFTWLPPFAALTTLEASTKSLSLIESWLDLYNKYDDTTWNISVLSERVFHLLSNYNFLLLANNHTAMAKVDKLLNLEINHLLHAYNQYGMLVDIHVAKAIIIIAFCKESLDKTLLKKGILLFNQAIKTNILQDGGHISRNSSITLEYLHHALIIYYLLKDTGLSDMAFLRAMLDKITIFIRTIRHPDGTLAIFNGSNEGNKKHIDLLLSLCHSSSQASVHLRYSKYTRLQKQATTMIFDLGTPTKNDNALLTFEVSVQQNKLITNLGTNFSANKDNILHQELFGRLSYSGLMMIQDNNELLFFPATYVKQEYRTEDRWEILKMNYRHDCLPFVSYYHTIYLSREFDVLILSEDLLSFKANMHNITFKEVFLRFHFSPLVKDLELSNYNRCLKIITANKNYFFISNDNPIKISQNIYSGDLGFFQKCYTIDIPFNLKNKIIKNEWSISSFNEKKVAFH